MFSKVEYNDKDLEEEKIERIKLEYYKVLKEDSEDYGIEINKIQTEEGRNNNECIYIENITNSDDVINKLLQVLSENKVTPIIAKDVIDDYMYALKRIKM